MLITLTGPTGSGKSTLAQALIEEGITLVPTWTTRPLRPDEQGRGDMVQVTHEAMRASEMLETAEYDGHWYGTPATLAVKDALAGVGVALKILEPQGLAKLQATLKDARGGKGGITHQLAHVYVFVDADTAWERLMSRCGGTPGPADLRRLQRASDECRTWPGLCQWSHIVDNNQDGASMYSHATKLLSALNVQSLLESSYKADFGSPGM